MDDDKVEYAEIENGRPKIAPATTKSISDSARNTEREATMGIYDCDVYNIAEYLLN